MKKFLAAIAILLILPITIPTQAAVADNLLEITSVNPTAIKANAPLQVSALVKSRQIQSVELWVSRNPVTDLTKIEQDVIPLAQAVVRNSQVTISRSNMPNLSAGVYQLVLRSISNSSVLGEQAVPIVAGNLPTKELAVIVPISVPPTSNEVSSQQTLLTVGATATVDWFIDGNTFNKIPGTELVLAGRINGIAAANPDLNAVSKYRLRNLLDVAITETRSVLSQPAIPVGVWQLRHQVDGNGMRNAISADLDYVISELNETPTKFRYNDNELTELTVDPTLTKLLATATTPTMVKQYVIAAAALTDAAAIAPPLGWAPGFPAATAFFAAVNETKWLETVPVQQVTNRLASKATSNISGKAPVFSVKHLRNLDQINRYWLTLNNTSATSPDSSITTSAISAASNWWWLARPSGNEYAKQVKQDLITEVNALRISSRNRVVLPDAIGVIPVTLTNNRTTPVEFNLAGQGLGTAVVRIDAVKVEIPAESKQVVELPIEVVTPGSIYAQLVIQGKLGEETTITPTPLQIEVSQYRAVAQVIIYGAFGVLLILSAISIRGRLRKQRAIQHN